MAWRSVVISSSSRLSQSQGALRVQQKDGDVRIPLEDIAVLVLDSPQISLTSSLLSACATAQIAVITVDSSHIPNGTLLAWHPHSRTLPAIELQLKLTAPRRKRLWKHIIQQKIQNQSAVLARQDAVKISEHLFKLSRRVKSGDSTNIEATAAQTYFRHLLPEQLLRRQDRFYNAALNYGYSIVRSALAKYLVGFGFITALGIHHRSSLNSFNLADDLLEPFRPIVDLHILQTFAEEPERELSPTDKAAIVEILHQDIPYPESSGDITYRTLLAAIEASCSSLKQCLQDNKQTLALPTLHSSK